LTELQRYLAEEIAEDHADGLVSRPEALRRLGLLGLGTGSLRNAGPLEFPTSPVLAGRTLCTTSSDGNRRDNSPNTAGEASPGSAVVGKVSCLDQRLDNPGERLPVG
jgi:hypothetical protein